MYRKTYLYREYNFLIEDFEESPLKIRDDKFNHKLMSSFQMMIVITDGINIYLIN